MPRIFRLFFSRDDEYSLWADNIGRDKGPFSAGRMESPIPDDVRIWLRLRFLDRRTVFRSTFMALHARLQTAAFVRARGATLPNSLLPEYLGATSKSTFGKCK